PLRIWPMEPGAYTSISLNDEAADRPASSIQRPASLAMPRTTAPPAAVAAEFVEEADEVGEEADEVVDDEQPASRRRRFEQLDEVDDSRLELRDRYHLVYLSMVLAGVGFLLPYNSFVNAVDFYQQRFDSHLIVFDISMTYITVMLGSVLLTNALVNRVHLRWRITFGYMIAIVVLFLTTFFDIILNIFPPEWSYRLTLISAGVVSLGCTIQQSSFYGYASLLPRRYTQAVMLGESCAGFIVSLNRIVTKSAVASAAPSTALFFILSSCLLLLCLLTFTLAVKSQFVRQFIRPTRQQQSEIPQRPRVAEDRERMLPGLENPAYQPEMMDLGYLDVGEAVLSPPPPNRADADLLDNGDSTVAAASATRTPRHLGVEAGLQTRLNIAHKVWLYMAAIALCYLVSLSLFPGIESEIPSCRLRDWMPVLLMAVFNGSDLVGKLLAAFPIAWRGGPLLACSIFRVCLVPLFMSCASPRQRPHISSESWACFVTALLGATNGYFGSLPMINAPKTVQSSHREIAGNLMTLSYSVGLTAGSGLSYWLDDLLGPIPAKLQPWQYACGDYNVSHVIGR
ncbi:hypothetical protein BOX15_Mlig030959g1, partial [Macrostomum lignano]